MGNDLIERQAAIDALHMHLMYRMGTDSNKKRLDEWINNLPSAQPERITLTEEERRTLKKMRTLYNGSYAKLLDKLFVSAQPDLDSAYTEGYTAAESKYRKMWDEMPKIVYCRECMYREYCFSDVAMTNRSQTSTIYESIEYCSKGERREQ